jgi:HK97 family phage portal protein
LITYEKLANGDKQRATDFTLYNILHDQPNPIMTSLELRELLMGHLCLRGNAYCLIERASGEVVALWPLHPDRVKVEISGKELIYTYQSEDGPEKKYQMEDILHIKGMSSDGILGYSPLALLRDTFGHVKAITEYSANYFKNDASPGGLLIAPNSLNAQSMANLRESWEKGHKGTNNKHRVAIMDNGLKWESIGISPQDSQMIESQKFSVVEIARIFRVPLNLVMDYERSTYSNVTEQNRSFLIHTLQPWLERFEQAIHKSLLTESEKKKYFVEHLTQSFLRANTKERYEAYKIARDSGFMSVNEIRQLENMNSVEGGDKY